MGSHAYCYNKEWRLDSMRFPVRRMIKGTLIVVGLILTAAGLYLGIQWRQAIADVDQMIVTPVALPIPTSLPTSIKEDSPVVASEPTPELVPTAEPELPDSPLNILLMGTD